MLKHLGISISFFLGNSKFLICGLPLIFLTPIEKTA
nr:MAG TPA: hypothetical protein [Caudoviricetes sp.]